MPLPVTLIGGFLGSGKTSLVNHVLKQAPGRRIGVLVNDFGEVNIDAELIVGVEADAIRLANGCVCCSMKSDLISALIRVIERSDAPEHVLVETSGVSNPGALVDTFRELQRSGVLRLDGVVSVVDAENFDPKNTKIGSLAACQVRAADLVVLSKVDLVSKARRAEVTDSIRALLPSARILEAERGAVPPEILLARHPESASPSESPLFRFDHASQFDSFTYGTERRFDFRALAPVLTALPPEVYRVKGIVHLVERPGDRLALHVVGRRVYVETLGPEAPLGRSVLGFVGLRGALEPQGIRAALEACER